MSNFDLHEFNILSQKHNYFMTNNRLNGFPVLKESSIFLKKILAQRTSNSSEKKVSDNLMNQNDLGGFKNKIRMYQSPELISNRVNTDNNYNIELVKPNNSRKINNQKKSIFSPPRRNNDATILNRIVTPTYYKIPMNVTNRLSKSPNIGGNYDINNNLDDEIKVLNFRGKKIFATNSFNGLSNHTQSNNTPVKRETSELFRNYDELKKKRDEIFRRKIKRDSSMYRKELLKSQKDKEIKEQTIRSNILDNKDKLRIIPLKKKLIIKRNNKTKFNSNDKDKTSENNIKNKSHNIIVLQKSQNLYNKKKFKTNNIFMSKHIKNKDKTNNINNNNINNHGPINQKIKDNLEYLRIKNEKSKTAINLEKQNEFKAKNKKFMEDYNENISQMIYSNDRKVSIKMNVLKDKNVIFAKEKKIQKNLEIQNLISIFYKCSKKNSDSNNDNKIKNKKFVKRIKNVKNTNTDALFSIKEEEEKSKQEKIIKKIGDKKEVKEEIKKERPISAFTGGVRNKYLKRLNKK